MTSVAVISAVGMATAIGNTASSTTAALRARLTRFREWPDYPCLPAEPPRPGEPFPVIAAYSDVARGIDVPGRLLALALQDSVTSSDLERDELEEASVLVARPSPSPSPHLAERRDAFFRTVASSSGIASFERARPAPDGNAAMLLALGQAAQAVTADPEACFLVAGADTLVEAGIFRELDLARRLKSRRNLDGFIPGEAAAALFVEHRRRAERRGATILAEIEGFGTGREQHAIDSESPATGEGLAAALSAACEAGGPPEWVLCDLNGESYRAKEWGHARLRAPDVLGAVRKLWHPADSYGDVGSATGGCLAGACLRSFARDTAPATRAVLFAGSADGTRAAVSLVSAGSTKV